MKRNGGIKKIGIVVKLNERGNISNEEFGRIVDNYLTKTSKKKFLRDIDREAMAETQEERIRRDIKTINKLAGIVKVSKEVSKEIVNEKGWIE